MSWQFFLLVLFVSVSAYKGATYKDITPAIHQQPREIHYEQQQQEELANYAQELPLDQRQKRQTQIYIQRVAYPYFEELRQEIREQKRRRRLREEEEESDQQQLRQERHQQKQHRQQQQQEPEMSFVDQTNNPLNNEPRCACPYQPTAVDPFNRPIHSQFPDKYQRAPNSDAGEMLLIDLTNSPLNYDPSCACHNQRTAVDPPNRPIDSRFTDQNQRTLTDTAQPLENLDRKQIAEAPTYPQILAPNPYDRFNTKLYRVIAPAHRHTNVVYSPLSLQTLLAFIYTGAEQMTAEELQKALELPPNIDQVLQIFQQLIQSQRFATGTQLIMANKLYHKYDLPIRSNISNVVAPTFDVEVEPIDFSYASKAADKINNWVADKTQNRINNLIASELLDSQMSAILVNAIHFKAKWAKELSTVDTSPNTFYTSDQRNVTVDMMFIDNAFRYADFPELQAQVVELPYSNSDMSMMIILPRNKDGLPALEHALRNIDLSALSDNLHLQMVQVRLPKFKIEFDIDMIEPLDKLGVKRLFSPNAQLRGIFQKDTPVGISRVQHKAYLDVNEAGSEAAAATFSKLTPLSLPPPPTIFTANHPFMFAIRNPRAVYFVGHVVNFYT